MGSFIEFNDTLQLTTAQGFPKELDMEKHRKSPFTAKDFKNRVFGFKNKPNMRLYHSAPVRVFLVHPFPLSVNLLSNFGVQTKTNFYKPWAI